jgi:ribosomal protein S18 acetylase RimI-like enzyme
MIILHWIGKIRFHLKYNGLKNTLREMVFINRRMIVIEKEIQYSGEGQNKRDIDCEILTNSNYKFFENKYNLNNVKYYAKKNCECLIAIQEGKCVGYQWWTKDNKFKDLKKIGLELKENEAYLFDLFVFPEYRGSNIPKIIANQTFDYLLDSGTQKIYGFYYGDNLKALWWHRAFLKCKEIKKIVSHRIFFINIVNGKLYL